MNWNDTTHQWRDAEARERAASEGRNNRPIPEGMGALVWLVGAVIVGIGGLAAWGLM